MHTIVSIIITNYNYGKFIARSIRSCLNQSIAAKTEVIVVDDASSDNSRQIIQEHFSDKVKTVFMKRNMGVAYCSNEGIRRAKGMYVIRVDADDYIHEKSVEILLEFLEMNPEYSFAYSDHFRVTANDQKLERTYLDSESALLEHGAGILFRKVALEAVGLYDPEMRNCEDMLLLKQLLTGGHKGIYVQLPLYRYMRHAHNMTNDLGARVHWKALMKERLENGKQN